jgi:hypothetical protein
MKQENRPMTRIEAFTDAAFAFALTMLVISFDALPRSVDELILAMKAIPAFLLSSTLLMMFWYQHSRWSQQYRLVDAKAVVLTCALVFTVMVYVYPLRLMTSGFMYWVSGGWLQATFSIQSYRDLTNLFIIYGIGYATMCGIMALLYRHALNQGGELGLSPQDRFDARTGTLAYVLLGTPGLVSIILCWLLPSSWAVAAPFAYAPLAVVMPWFGMRRARARGQLIAGIG